MLWWLCLNTPFWIPCEAFSLYWQNVFHYMTNGSHFYQYRGYMSHDIQNVILVQFHFHLNEALMDMGPICQTRPIYCLIVSTRYIWNWAHVLTRSDNVTQVSHKTCHPHHRNPIPDLATETFSGYIPTKLSISSTPTFQFLLSLIKSDPLIITSKSQSFSCSSHTLFLSLSSHPYIVTYMFIDFCICRISRIGA